MILTIITTIIPLRAHSEQLLNFNFSILTYLLLDMEYKINLSQVSLLPVKTKASSLIKRSCIGAKMSGTEFEMSFNASTKDRDNPSLNICSSNGSSSFIMCLFRKINFEKNCQKKRFWEKKKTKKVELSVV